MDSQNIMFVVLAVLIIFSSFATVMTKSIVRAATYLLFVLLGTAGMYFLMGYTFLGSVQVMVYAGGIIVLYVFSILLTEGAKEETFKRKVKDASWGFLLALVGFCSFLGVVLTHNFKSQVLTAPARLPAQLLLSNLLVTTCFLRATMATCFLSRLSVYCFWLVS